MSKNRVSSKGFTLVETAVVLVIGSLILTMLFNSLNIYLKNTKLSTTRERLAEVEKQIQIFLNNQGHLPCPAPLGGVAVDALAYGIETDCGAAAVAGQTFGTGTVRIGMIPTRTLNLPDEFGYDAWGSRMVYGVTTNLAINEDIYDPDNGAISIIDSNDNSVIGDAGTGHFVILSHGVNQMGAYNTNGVRVMDCTTGGLSDDEENCNNDDIFRNTVLTADAGGAADFDDIVVSRSMSDFGQTIPSQAVMLFRLDADECPEGWTDTNVPTGAPAGYIYCRKP